MPFILPLHSYIPSQFNCRFSCFLRSSMFSLCSNFLCSRLIQSFSWHCISEVVRGLFFNFFQTFRQLFINFVIQADIPNTLRNYYLSSEKSNKSFCVTVVANIFLIILASFSDLLDSIKIDWSDHLIFSAIYDGPFD